MDPFLFYRQVINTAEQAKELTRNKEFYRQMKNYRQGKRRPVKNKIMTPEDAAALLDGICQSRDIDNRFTGAFLAIPTEAIITAFQYAFIIGKAEGRAEEREIAEFKAAHRARRSR